MSFILFARFPLLGLFNLLLGNFDFLFFFRFLSQRKKTVGPPKVFFSFGGGFGRVVTQVIFLFGF